MKHLYICLCLLLFTTSLTKAQTGRITAFINPAAESRADADFQKNILPELKAYADKKGLDLRVLDVRDGAPSTVVHTPLVLFHNHKGSSIFSARKHEVQKYLNFIRTARVVPQKWGFIQQEQVAMKLFGRMKIAAKFKITDLKGSIPAEFDQNAFREKLKTVLTASLEGFQYYDEMPMMSWDRIFYMDFHPYLGADGQLYLSSELYSQFNCIDPIFSNLKMPLTGKWEAFESLFSEAGQLLGKEMLHLSKTSTIGDAFEPVPNDTPIKTELDLGLTISKAPELSQQTINGFEASGTWKILGPIDEDTPMTQFTFLSPLDYYSGTVDNLEGSLTFPDNGLDQVKGSFKIKLAGVTMGDSDLDQAITGFILNATEFPDAQFELTESKGDDALWDNGQGANFKAIGQFNLSGATAEVPVDAHLDPVVLDNGAIGLNVFATYELKLKDDFKVEKGPDGPDPANQTLVFYMNFLMEKTP